jgi:hypothetical protein
MDDSIDDLLQLGHLDRRVAVHKLCNRVLCLGHNAELEHPPNNHVAHRRGVGHPRVKNS